jgi:hypothetical protein
VEPEVQRVAPEDVAHVVAADDDHLAADFFGDRLQTGWAHLARRSDREAIACDEERLAAMDARAKIGHQVAERSGLPALVERVEALGHAVGCRRNLIGVDRVQLFLFAGNLQVPENQRLAANGRCDAANGLIGGCRNSFNAGLQSGALNRLHDRLPY